MITPRVTLIWFLLFIVMQCGSNTAYARSSYIPVDRETLLNVVKIETFSELQRRKVTGTGFLISREVRSGTTDGKALFLVTNKHLVSDWTLADGTITRFNRYITVNFHRNDPYGERIQPVKIPLCNDQGQAIPRMVETHEDGLVDIAIVSLNKHVQDVKNIPVTGFKVSYLLPFDSISSNIKKGSQVCILGYPLGITSIQNTMPVAKFGFIASPLGEEVSLTFKSKNRKRHKVPVQLTGKLVILHGPISPGNSGGPVVLPSAFKTRINPLTQRREYMTRPADNLVIGILSGGSGSSGLNYVYSSDYIIETLDRFFQKYHWEPADSRP